MCGGEEISVRRLFFGFFLFMGGFGSGFGCIIEMENRENGGSEDLVGVGVGW